MPAAELLATVPSEEQMPMPLLAPSPHPNIRLSQEIDGELRSGVFRATVALIPWELDTFINEIMRLIFSLRKVCNPKTEKSGWIRFRRRRFGQLNGLLP